MKLTLQHVAIRSTRQLDSWMEERLLALKPRLKIDEAKVRLVHDHRASPPYSVHVHLVTPGPDIFATAYDHTLLAAWEKAMKGLLESIGNRVEKRTQRLKGSLSSPTTRSRPVSAH